MSLARAHLYLASTAWALMPEVMDQLVAVVDRHAFGEKLTAEEIKAAIGRDPAQDQAREPGPRMVGSVAIVPIFGVLARYADQVNGVSQGRGTSAEQLLNSLEAVAADPAVSRIVLQISSPGGAVNGSAEVADLVRRVSAIKPVTAYIDGLAASAAYWIASQATEIVASSDAAQVGSIGIMSIVRDASGVAGDGSKSIVIRSGPLKAPGVAGSAITDDQLASLHRQVGELAAVFHDAVAAGRGLAGGRLTAVTTGEVWAARQGVAMGLIDRIAPLSELLTTAGASIDPGHQAHRATEEPMDAKTMAELISAHQAHAALIATEAIKDGATKAGIESLIEKATASAALAKANEAVAKITADLEAEKAAHAATKAELVTAQARIGVMPKHEDPGGNTSKPAKTQAEIEAMTPIERSAFFNEGGTVTTAA